MMGFEFPSRRSVGFAALAGVAVLLSVACSSNNNSSNKATATQAATRAASAAATTAATTAAATAAASPSAAAPTGGTIKLGMATDISAGATAELAKAGINGAQLALDQLNAAGGVLGKKVEIVIKDSAAKPEDGANLARELILNDKVVALLGPVSSAVAESESTIAKQNKIPIILYISNSERLTEQAFHRYAFQVVPNTFMEATAAAQFAAKLGIKDYYVLASDYEFGHLQADAFEARIKQLLPDIKKDGEQFPKLNSTDFTSVISAILNAKPTFVYDNVYGGDLVTLVKQAKPQGLFDKTKFLGAIDITALQTMKQDAPEGMLGYSRGPFYALDSAEAKAFTTTYKAKYNVYPAEWSVLAYDAVMLWANTVKKAGTTDAEKFVDTAEGQPFPSLRGNLTIRKCDHMANSPEYVGTLGAFNQEYGFAVLKDVTTVSGDASLLSCEEVQKLQPK